MNLREKLEKIGKAKGLVLSPYHVHKIDNMVKTGHCDCDSARKCPCAHINEEVEEYGSCLCRVLVTPATLKKQAAYYRKKK